MDVSSEPRVETLIRYVNKFILLINVLCHDMKHPNYKNCSPEKHYLPEITQLYFSLIFVKYHYIEKKKKTLSDMFHSEKGLIQTSNGFIDGISLIRVWRNPTNTGWLQFPVTTIWRCANLNFHLMYLDV